MKSTISKTLDANLNAGEDKILFVLENGHKSHDKDFYCVFRGNSGSRVVAFTNETKIWTEFFIDNENDLVNKLDKYDEIVINFLSTMMFAEGDFDSYSKYKKAALEKKSSFTYPAARTWALKYRIQALYFKYINYLGDGDHLQSGFILNAINYPLVQLMLITHHVTPASPKQWVSQLKETLDDYEFKLVSGLITHKISPGEMQKLYDKYVGVPEDRVLLKEKNALTFIT